MSLRRGMPDACCVHVFHQGPALLWALSALWSLSQVFFCGLHYASAKFRAFTPAQRLKVVKYMIQITWGSVIVVLYTVLQLKFDGWLESDCTKPAASPPQPEPEHEHGHSTCAFEWSWPYTRVITLYGALYVWELIHEGAEIHNSLALHHFCIVVVWHVAVGYYGTRVDLTGSQLQAIGDMGFPQLVAAGLEQPVFVALLMHRFGSKPAARTRAFQVAWMTFAASKAVALLASFAVIVTQWSKAPVAYRAAMLLTLVALAPTQAYSAIVLRRLAGRMAAKGRKEEADNAADAAAEKASP